MALFKLHLHLTKTPKFVNLIVEADSWDSANDLAAVLASQMPSEPVYFDKSDVTRETDWSGYAEDVKYDQN